MTVAAAKAAGAAGKVLYQGEFGGPSPRFTGPSVEDVAYPVSILDAQVQSAQDSGAFVLSTIWAWECPSHRSQMICIWPNSSRANESGSDHMVSVLRRVNAEMAPTSEDGGSTGVASFDVLVYGATSGGVAAAVAASRHGLKVGMLVANGGGCGPTDAGSNHIGGMSSGGLGKTDLVGDSGKLIGGIAAEFYSSNARHYNTTAPPSYDHEPHVAQRTFDELLANSTVSVIRGGHGANIVSAQKHGRVIESITVADGRKFAAEVFIDSSYEGDLMAAAGVSYTVGREAASVYNESLAGRRPDDFSNDGYEFVVRVDPFDADGKPLPLLETVPDSAAPGAGDRRVESFNFRLCATSDPRPGMRAPFPAVDEASVFAADDVWELGRRFFRDSNWEKHYKVTRGGKAFPCLSCESPALDQATGYKRDW